MNHSGEGGGLLTRRLLPAPLYVLRGALFLWAHRELWKYAAAPLAISLVVLGGSYILLYYVFSHLVGQMMGGEWYWQALYYMLLVIVGLIVLVVFFFIFTLVASALASPFNEVISQKTEQIITGTFHEAPFSAALLLKDSGRAIAHSFRILGLYILLLVLVLPLLLIPGIGSLLFAVASALLSAYKFAHEYLGYPMDRRRFSWQEKRAFLKSGFRSIMGFGLGNLVIASIPVVNLFFIPAAVVGGTLLFLDLNEPEQIHASRGTT
ncbi:MAG: EI24 domain-containing protein [Desulfomonile tiedjei]|nr:EI24 domain-containing protein [Desulfomonile tiedjei]